MATPFETKTCPRCGGSGHYSFNRMDGTRCYGCHGTGYQLTRRGKAAASHLEALISRPAGEVQVGNFIFESKSLLGQRRWLKVTRVVTEGLSTQLHVGGDFSLSVGTLSLVRCITSEADRQTRIAEALAYQESLTKAGNPRKR